MALPSRRNDETEGHGIAHILFRSADLLVRYEPAADRARCAITFDSHGVVHALDRPAFGAAFFASQGIGCVGITCSGNDWYQYPELPDALAAIRAALHGAERVMTYGSSMGAYAAIRFADAVGANACLALSPQYSNDPAKVPFERRWPQEGGTIRWLPALDGPIRCGFAPVIVFDPRGADGAHARMIAADTPIAAVALPYTAHPVTTYLANAGLLAPLALAVLDGSFAAGAFTRTARAGRHADPVYLSELARRQPDTRGRLGVALARRAFERAPDNALVVHTLAGRLTAVGAHAEALPLHARAVAAADGYTGYALPYSRALAAAGDMPAALALARTLARAHPGIVQVHGWLADLLWTTGDRAAAIVHARAALRLAPANAHHGKRLARYGIRHPLGGGLGGLWQLAGAMWMRGTARVRRRRGQ